MDSKMPRRVRTRRNHAAMLGLPAYCERLPAQRWIAPLFNCAEKSVKVEMKNGSR
jgi:hypothetical protein